MVTSLFKKVLAILLLLIVLWIWYFHYNDNVNQSICYNDIKWKTGDLMLFRGNDNIYPIFFGNTFSHVGIVYIDSYNVPRLLEACNTKKFVGVSNRTIHDVINTYNGTLYFKQLIYPIDSSYEQEFEHFANFSCENFQYEKRIIYSTLMNYLTNTPIQRNLNCGELSFLSLIKLGLIDLSQYKNAIKLHYLKYITYITKVKDNEYSDTIVKITNIATP